MTQRVLRERVIDGIVIGAAALTVAAGIASIVFFGQCTGADATAGARAFAEREGLNTERIVCSNTPERGYVACKFELVDGSDEYRDCAAPFTRHRGCKPAKMSVRRASAGRIWEDDR